MKKRRVTTDYVVRLLDSRSKTRDCVVSVESDMSQMPQSYNFYLASLLAMETKAKEGERVVRVSVKGYS